MGTETNAPVYYNDLDGDVESRESGARIVTISLDADLASALEGWRAANNLSTTEAAAAQLVRLGLLGELSESFATAEMVRKAID